MRWRYLIIVDNKPKDRIQGNLGDLCRHFDFEVQPAAHILKISDYESMGRSVALALLDLIDLNPRSRIANTPLKNMRVRKLTQF